MKRALVTGATGFVGANLARRLLADGHRVIALVRPRHDPWRLADLGARVEYLTADLSDLAGLRQAIDRARPDWIFHLAVYGAYSDQADLDGMLATNLHGTINLVRAAGDVGCDVLVNTGSSSEYGLKTSAPDETTWLEPNSHYAITKAAATQYCSYAAQSTGRSIVTLRLYSVFGPWEEPRRLMPTLIRQGLVGRLPPLVGPAIARDYIYVDDVVAAYLLVASAGRNLEPVYNVGTGVQTTLGEVVAIARRHLPIADEPSWGSMPPRTWDTTAWVADSHRLREQLGWSPAWSVESGFGAFVEWFRADPARLDAYAAREHRLG